MAENESITLGPRKHDKLGPVHCGVVREGVISCGGELKNIDDGQEIQFERTGIAASRKGEEYTFTKMH